MSFRYSLIIFGLFAVLTAGCGSNVEIGSYEVPDSNPRGLTTDILRSQFPPVPPFAWSAPAEWRSAENDEFSQMAWAIGEGGMKGGPGAQLPEETASARITISRLTRAAGIEQQFVRWRGQLNLPEKPVADVMKDVETFELKGGSGMWIRLQNDSAVILGMIVPVGNDLWIFKWRSAIAIDRQSGAGFRKFCETLEVTQALTGDE